MTTDAPERGLAGCSVLGCEWTSDNPEQHCPLHHREDSGE
jgi:hypothetical protein